MPNSLYRMPLIYLFLACVFCNSCSFLFVVFSVFVFFFCSHWSLVDVPLIFFCPADHVPDWQPRILLGIVEARSVNVKKTTTTKTTMDALQAHNTHPALQPTDCRSPSVTIVLAEEDKIDPSGVRKNTERNDLIVFPHRYRRYRTHRRYRTGVRKKSKTA